MKPNSENPFCKICKKKDGVFLRNLTSENKTSNLYRKGQIIFHEGNKPLGLFCVNQGKIKMHKSCKSGKDQIVQLAKEGELLGYRALVSGESYTASATALEDCVICFIPKNSFFEMLNYNPKLSMHLVKILSNDLISADTKTTRLARKPVKERLAETLLKLKEIYGIAEDGNTLNVSLTREEIANIVGTATEIIIRLLSELKKESIINLQGRKLQIVNYEALVNTANICD